MVARGQGVTFLGTKDLENLRSPGGTTWLIVNSTYNFVTTTDYHYVVLMSYSSQTGDIYMAYNFDKTDWNQKVRPWI